MRSPTWLPLLVLVIGCNDVTDTDDQGDEDHGLTTTVVLSFTPDDGGDTLSFTWADPEDDGDPVVDDIVLPDGGDGTDHVAQAYTVEVELLNELEDPVGDVTVEVAEEGEEHQLFFTGTAVEGPATGDSSAAVVEHAYADTDDSGLPLGLQNTFTTLALGSGELTVTLRHMPPEDGAAIKVEGLAEDVAEGGFSAIGGENDVQVSFDLTVE